MHETQFEDGLEQLLAGDSRYHRDAYKFIAKAVEYIQKHANRANKRDARVTTDEAHPVATGQKRKNPKRRNQLLTGPELLAGVREYGLSEFGPMAMDVFAEWGIHSCRDFGELAFSLTSHGLLKKMGDFTSTDFADGYDFSETFRQPFRPKNRLVIPVTAPEAVKA